MLAILTFENAKVKLSENASGMPIPWALIKDSFFAFIEHLYSQNILLCNALDSDTANFIHPIMKSQSISLSVSGDAVVLLWPDSAKALVNVEGEKRLGASWKNVGPHIDNFLDHLYVHNIFIARAEGMATTFLFEKMKDGKNLLIRVNNMSVQQIAESGTTP